MGDHEKRRRGPDWRDIVILVVAIVWGINFCAPIFTTDFQPSPELNIAFMAIIGVLTATKTMPPDEK